MKQQPELRLGAIFEGDTVVCQLPDGDWLLMAPHDTHKRLEWGCLEQRVGADGTGRENTDAMLAAGSPAAAYCRAALGKPYDLPSRGELAMLYQQRDLLGLEGFGWAWTSTEFSSTNSWFQSFSDGNQSNDVKRYEYWVVPVRRISPVHFSAGKAASLREQRDELEIERQSVAAFRKERDALRSEIETLREIREIASQCAANGGYLCSRDLIELRELLEKTK